MIISSLTNSTEKLLLSLARGCNSETLHPRFRQPLAIALVVAFLVTGAALRARFRHNDAYDGPPGVQASPYVGVA